GAIKTRLHKIRLAKALKKNRSIPPWKRELKHNKQEFNFKKRSWRRNKLKVA
ncbi:Ribosomal protein L39, partial [Trachipleistophora hominis]